MVFFEVQHGSRHLNFGLPFELRDGKCLTFTVSERHDLFRVLLQGAHAEVEIPEIEFSIRPKAERRVDTIYNMMLGEVGQPIPNRQECTFYDRLKLVDRCFSSLIPTATVFHI